MDHIISKQTVLLLNYPWHLYKNLYYWTTWRCRDTTRNFKNLYYWTTWRCKDSELPDTCTKNSLIDALIGLAMEVPDVPDLASHLGLWSRSMPSSTKNMPIHLVDREYMRWARWRGSKWREKPKRIWAGRWGRVLTRNEAGLSGTKRIWVERSGSRHPPRRHLHGRLEVRSASACALHLCIHAGSRLDEERGKVGIC